MKIGYWVATALVGFAFAAGGLIDLFGPAAPQMLSQLGYPGNVAYLLGAWKVLGAAVVLAPALPRLKEWAYAGMIFDVTGAAYSHGMAGDPAWKIITPLVIGAIVIASWLLRPESRKLPSRETSATPVAASAPRVVAS